MAKKNEKVAKAKRAESKALTQQKRRRRKWITFVRMCRYGINNFTRNAWLTLAAMAVMTITLLIIMTGVVSHKVLTDTVDLLRDRVSMSMYLETDTSAEDAQAIVKEVEALESVVDVTVKSPEDIRTDFINENADNADALEAVKEATNKFPWTLNIKVVDINDTAELTSYTENSELFKEHSDKSKEASFAGDRREAIASIGRAANFAQNLGIVASVIFISISMMIIFNTIRMAIFNRREEIQMMKLIGAERSFIRGPFVVEAVVYGFFAALFASGIGYALVNLVAPFLKSAEINVQPTMDAMMLYIGFVILAMIMIGAVIGIISSLLATRRYLKEWS